MSKADAGFLIPVFDFFKNLKLGTSLVIAHLKVSTGCKEQSVLTDGLKCATFTPHFTSLPPERNCAAKQTAFAIRRQSVIRLAGCQKAFGSDASAVADRRLFLQYNDRSLSDVSLSGRYAHEACSKAVTQVVRKKQVFFESYIYPT